ncbi:hypothetical protein, partial [Burkholderia cepacia]|uniref:hypothetical protein n=1 Tax=Burkholderia cepacia TaxID=292 RepID=UPI001CC4CFFF
SSAISLPMPLAAPVTTAVLPFRSAAMSVSSRCRIKKVRARHLGIHRMIDAAGQPPLCTIGPAVRAQNV